MHYGDSQLECDYMSSTLRTYMQELFGGGGVGLLSPNYYDYKETTSRSQSPEPESYLVFDQRNHKLSNGKYGITGHSIQIDGNQNYTVTSTAKDKFPTSYTFSKVSLVASNEVSVTANGNKMKLEAEREGMKIYSTRVDPTNRCSIHVNGKAYLYGLMLDTPTGVSVDNIALRGCSGTIFTGIEKSSFAPFYQMQDVGLIILQFGGNTAESLHTEEECKQYAETIRRQLKMFKQIAPKSKILFIPPADMGTSIKGKKQTYPILPTFNNTLKKMCMEEGVAFWNMFEAMGGMNTIVQWVNADPPLAIRDYTHFTPLGAQTVTKILCETFQIYYNSYRLRKGEKLVEMPKEQVVEKPADKKSGKKKVEKQESSSKKVDEAEEQSEETKEKAAPKKRKTKKSKKKK